MLKCIFFLSRWTGGKVLLDFKQETPADTVPLDRVLHVLGIGRQSRTFSVESH